MKTKKKEELLKLLLTSGKSDKDIARSIHRADRGTFIYWVKFLVIFLIRFLPTSGIVLLSCMGKLFRGGEVPFNPVSDLVSIALLHCWWIILIEFTVCSLCYCVYRYDPSDTNMEAVFEQSTWDRCTSRQANFLVWSILFDVLLLGLVFVIL